ncbi:hypothetical protein [Qipengyuania mesophila]|uniref:hypothetical protein n=1 Tax=Qipengyuania mesophila TaxID=2867246 RepID=UPI0035136749
MSAHSRRRIFRASLKSGVALAVIAMSPVPLAASDGEDAAPSQFAGRQPERSSAADSPAVEERQSYALRLMMQVYDGRDDLSHTQLLGIGRVRKGNRSLTRFDYGDGAVVIRKEEGDLAAGKFVNVSATEKQLVYNYDSKTMQGDREIAAFHNAVIRPWLDRGPELGQDVQWSMSVPLSALAMKGLAGQAIRIELAREYFVHDGKPMVLVHYAIPAFTYRDDRGRLVVQWARGLSLTDPGFGMIYLNSALHRAVARGNGSASTPYRLARTMVAANPDGSAMIDYRTVPQLQPHLEALFGKEAVEVIPADTSGQQLDDRPLELGRRLDLLALSVGENGANEVPATAAAQGAEDRGTEFVGLAAATLQAAQQQQDQQQDAAMVETIGAQIAADQQKAANERELIEKDTQTTVAEMFRDEAPPSSSTSSAATPPAPAPAPASTTTTTSSGRVVKLLTPTGTTRGGDGGGSLLDEVPPGTLDELRQSSEDGTGITGSFAGQNDPAAVFGGGGDDPGLGAIAGKYYGGDAGERLGEKLDDIIDFYGTPDKFVAAAGGIAALQEDLEDVLSDAASFEEAIRGIGDVESELASLAGRLNANAEQIRKLENLVNTNLGNLPIDETEKLLMRLEELKRESTLITREIQSVDRKLQYLKSVEQSMPGLYRKIQQLSKLTPSSGIANTLAKISGFLDKIEGPLAFLGGVGNVGSVYQTGTDLGTFKTTDKDLKLSGDYDSAGAFVSSLTLDLLGILGNAAAGNPATTFADVATFASGKFVDLYKVVAAERQTRLDTQQTLMRTELNRKKSVNELQDRILAARAAGNKEEEAFLIGKWLKLATTEEVEAFYRAHPADYDSPIYTEETKPGGVSSPDWQNPNLDPNTSLPKPEYWAYLKKNDPTLLASFGIDPEAPVGGWPGGIGPEHRPKEELPQQPASPPKPAPIPVEPDYPTAPPRPPSPAPTPGPAAEEPPPPPPLTEAEARLKKNLEDNARATEELDAYQAQKLADLKAEEGKGFGDTSFRQSSLETSDLVTSVFDMDPVTFTGVDWDPVTFDEAGDLFDENGNLKKVGPDDFVMTPFDPPEASRFPPTDPDDLDGYPGTGEMPAFTYESMVGQEPDLAQWEEWLSTQDIAFLERLARAAGYPSLAFALQDAERIMRLSSDQGYRQYVNRGPNCAGTTGCTGSVGPWKIAWATVKLGDILSQSREIFSTGGFSDIGISGFNLMYILRDFGVEDGDLIDVEISQFGRVIFSLKGHFLLNEGSPFNVGLRPGVAQMVITALNEGTLRPNTAEVTIANVVRGDATQTYSLETGQTAVLRIEADATPEPSSSANNSISSGSRSRSGAGAIGGAVQSRSIDRPFNRATMGAGRVRGGQNQ